MIVDATVLKAGYFFIGHHGVGNFKLTIGYSTITIKVDQRQSLSRLLLVLGMDDENGVYLHDVEGKFCRLEYDNKMSLLRVGHITKDIWFNV